MKVLHIISGLSNGGAEAVLYRLCTFSRSNQHIVISLSEGGMYENLLKKSGVEVICIEIRLGALGGVLKLIKIVLKIKPDVVQTWMYHADLIGGFVAFLCGNRRIFWGIHATSMDYSMTTKSTLWVVRINSILSKFVPKKIICCANKTYEAHLALGYPESKLETIYNGYDLTSFKWDCRAGLSIRQSLGITHSDLVIGHVGRFHPQKDHANLLEAVYCVKQEYHSVKCLLVGPDINDKNHILTNLISELGLKRNVILMGERRDIPAVMNALDIHVLSSAFGEAFPNVLNEAMACGTPCVSTDVGDSKLIVGNTGWVVPVKNSRKLGEALIAALTEKINDSDKWKKRKQGARVRILNNFSIELMVKKYSNVWSET